MRIEDHQLDIRETEARHELGQPLAHMLHSRRCRGLAEVAAGIRESGLNAKPSARPQIGRIMRVHQAILDDLEAPFEGLRRLEKWRDIQLLGYAEEPREVE